MTLKPPLRLWRLVGLALCWNLLLLTDISVLHVSAFGPFSFLAYGCTASIFFTIPRNAYPGSL